MLWVLAAAFVLYILMLTHWINVHRMFWTDELLGWFFYLDPSWDRVMRNWVAGREGAGYLFNLTARSIVRIAGPEHLNSIRYYSSLCIAAGFLLWTAMLTRLFRTLAVIVPCAVLWLADPVILTHIAESRFYGQYILGTALIIWTAVRVEEEAFPAWTALLISLTCGTIMAGSQVLGLFWIGLVILGQLLTRRFTPAKIASVLGFVLSLWQIVPYRSLFGTSKNLKDWWIRKPTLELLIRAYLGSSFVPHIVALCMIVSIVTAGILVRKRRQQEAVLSPGGRMLLVQSSLFACGPLLFFAISHSFQSIFLGRYLIPTSLAFSGLFSWSVSEWMPVVKKRLGGAAVGGLAICSSLLVVGLHVRAMRETAATYEPLSRLDGLLSIPGSAPILFEDLVKEMQLHLYHPAQASRFYVTVHPDQFNNRAFLTFDFYYWPYYVVDQKFFAENRQIIYLQTRWANDMGLDRYLSDPDWTATRLPDVNDGDAHPLRVWNLARRQ